MTMHQTQEMNERRRSQSRRVQKSSELTSSQLVVYRPPADRSSPPHNKPPNRLRRQVSTNRPNQLGGGIQLRSGDIRTTYKVLPIVIGTGSFGTVRSCIHRESRTKLAIKSIVIKGKVPANASLVMSEIALLQKVNHRNVVRVEDVVQDREYMHIVMEQCRGGDLFDMTVDGKIRLSEGRIRTIIASLMDAVVYLHERNIVHRDLKAEHLMFSRNDINSPIKIIDFGVATLHKPGDPPLTAFAGSVRSVAPEVVKRRYGKECDIWSCGVITYFLLIHLMPFDAQSSDPNEIFQKIVSGRFGYPQWTETGLSEEVKDFIDRLLEINPKKRLTAKQALFHPWVCNKKVKKERRQSRPQSKVLVAYTRASNKLRRRY